MPRICEKWIRLMEEGLLISKLSLLSSFRFRKRSTSSWRLEKETSEIVTPLMLLGPYLEMTQTAVRVSVMTMFGEGDV